MDKETEDRLQKISTIFPQLSKVKELDDFLVDATTKTLEGLRELTNKQEIAEPAIVFLLAVMYTEGNCRGLIQHALNKGQ